MVLSAHSAIRRSKGLTMTAKLTRFQSYSLFLPSIIKALGYKRITAQLFTVPPNVASFCVDLITAGFSDRIKARGYFMIGGCVIAIAGYIMLLAASQNSVKYGGTFLVACGVFQGSPMVSVSHPRLICTPDSGRSWAGSQTTLLHTLSGRRPRAFRLLLPTVLRSSLHLAICKRMRKSVLIVRGSWFD